MVLDESLDFLIAGTWLNDLNVSFQRLENDLVEVIVVRQGASEYGSHDGMLSNDLSPGICESSRFAGRVAKRLVVSLTTSFWRAPTCWARRYPPSADPTR